MSSYEQTLRRGLVPAPTYEEMARAFDALLAPYRDRGITAVQLLDLILPNAPDQLTRQQRLVTLYLNAGAPRFSTHPRQILIVTEGVEFLDEMGEESSDIHLDRATTRVLRRKLAHLPDDERRDATNWYFNLLLHVATYEVMF